MTLMPHFAEDESKLFSVPDGSVAVWMIQFLNLLNSPLLSFARASGNSCFVRSDNSFSSHMDQVYNEIVHWRRNIFKPGMCRPVAGARLVS